MPDYASSISAGNNNTAIITSDNNLWMCGLNNHGQLGDGSNENKTTPEEIMRNVKAISLGGWHTAIIKTDNTLWLYGSNEYGQLGDGSVIDNYNPQKIMDDVIAVATGNEYTLAIKSDRTLWGWGRNNDGQLGDGTTTDRSTPIKIMDNVVAVSANGYNTAAIKSDGSLWTWGNNESGEIGDGTTTDKHNPVKIMENVAAISVGFSHAAAIKTDKSLWAWGDNHLGEIGDGTTEDKSNPVKIMDNVKMVAAGGTHTSAVRNDGSLWVWGYNHWGALGTGDGGGDYNNYKTSPTKLMDNVVETSTGWNHTLALQRDGTLWGWGNNAAGELGDGTIESRYSPIKITNINDIDKNAPKNIKIGDYINMGTYYGEPMVWRCVSFEKITGYDENGNPIIDSTDTVKEYKEGYLPLMLADKIICLKPYDASGFNTSGSHGRGMYYNGTVGYFRKEYGSNYWGDSNIRCWLNSDADAGQVEWLCGNPPTNMNVYNHYNEYDSEAGFLTNFTSNEREIIKPVTQKAILDGYEYDSSTCVDNYFIGTIKDIDEAIQNYDTAYSEMITDSMFLPDVRQAVEIYNNSDILGEKYYVGKLSEQAAQNSELKNEHIVSDGLYTYYLRTPMTVTGSSETQSYHDAGSGLRTIDAEGQVSNAVFGVGQGIRPAFFLTEDVNFTYGDGTEKNPYSVEKYKIPAYNWNYYYYNLKGDLDLTDFSDLKTLICPGNKIKSISLSGCDNLEVIDLSNNLLTDLLVASSDMLTVLNCNGNYLDTEDISEIKNISSHNGVMVNYSKQNVRRDSIYSENDLAILKNAFENTNLWNMAIDPDNWYGICWEKQNDIYRCVGIDIRDFEIEGALNLSGLDALRYLYCSGNNLGELDVTGCTSLENLSCANCSLTNLAADSNVMEFVNCEENYLDSQTIEKMSEAVGDGDALTQNQLTHTDLNMLDGFESKASVSAECGDNIVRVMITPNSEADTENFAVAVASYTDGALSSVEILSPEEKNGNLIFDGAIEGNTSKVMVWDDVNKMQPVCEPLVINK